MSTLFITKCKGIWNFAFNFDSSNPSGKYAAVQGKLVEKKLLHLDRTSLISFKHVNSIELYCLYMKSTNCVVFVIWNSTKTSLYDKPSFCDTKYLSRLYDRWFSKVTSLKSFILFNTYLNIKKNTYYSKLYSPSSKIIW